MNDNKKLFLIFFLFLLVQISFIIWHQNFIISDDYIYLSFGNLLSEGKIPYKDFFVAHPPLQLIIYAILIKLFGLNIWFVNAVPLISIMVSAFLAYKITNKWYASLFFLTFFPIFHLSSIGFGLNLGLMFIMLAIYTKNPYLSGIFAGLSVFSRLHFLPLAFFCLLMHKSKANKGKYLVGLTIMAVLFLFMLIIIPNAMNNLLYYHAFKDLQYFTTIRWFILGFGLRGMMLSYKTKYFWLFTSYFSFLMVLKSVFAYYIIPMGALLALVIAEKKLDKWYTSLSMALILGVSLGATILTIMDVSQNKADISAIVKVVSGLDGRLCGNGEIVPLLSLMTNKEVKDNEFDTNYQRRKALNCSNSIAVHRLREFPNCKLIKKEKKYKISLCS